MMRFAAKEERRGKKKGAQAARPKKRQPNKEDKSLIPEARSPKPEARSPKPEARSPEARSPKPELSYLPNPADCIDCREISAVDAIPCMRSLKSSALEAFSRAVS
jgi:hypothetical protein